MSNHSPEPWKPYFCDFITEEERRSYCCGYVDGSGGIDNLSDAHDECHHIVDLVDMQRICACVNAFVGVPIELIEAVDQEEIISVIGTREAILQVLQGSPDWVPHEEVDDE